MTSQESRTPSRTVIVCHIITALLVLTGSASAHPQEQQRFSVRPESVEVVEGSDVFLSCVVEHQQGKAQWTKDGFALGFERDVPGYPRYTYAGDPDLGEHHLVISGVTLTEDGEYQCQVGPTDTSPPLWAAANVTVLLAPTGISLVGWGDGAVVEVTEGTTLTLECVVTDARPAPSAAWYRAGHRLLPEAQVDRVEASSVARRWSVRSQLEVTAGAADDGRLFSCQALHPTLAADPNPLTASITLSVLHPPGPPVVSGYDPGEVLVAGERRTLSCKSSGGNPRPWVLWYRQERLLDDTSTTVRAKDDLGEQQGVVVNDHELAVTPHEDGAVYECRVSNDLLEFPLTTNVTLTVYYPPATVTISGPAQVGVGSPFNLTCETSDSNPPASLTWTLQGEVMETSKSVVGREGSGGWVTSSALTHYTVRSANVTEVKVECRALNPAVEDVVTKVTTVTIIRPAGRPVFESDLREEVIAGTSLDLTCLSIGGHPPPSVRVYKDGEELATEVVQEAGLTRARLAVEVTSADNGAEVSCEVTNPASKTPLVTSATLSVLFPPWEVLGTVAPGTVEEGQVATLACHTSASRPTSNITWRSQGAILEGGIFTTSRGAFGGASSRSELHLSTTAEDNGRSFICEASNGLGVTVNTELVLNVLHSPVWVVQPPEQLDVYEGAQLVVTATAAANPGPLRYWWRRGEATLEATDGELRLGRVSRSHSGNYSVNAYNPRGAVNASFILNVQYGPEKVQSAERVTVGEGGAATVECSAAANPSPTLTWTRATHNSTAQTLSSGVGVARLVIDSATWADTGVYLCHASNIVSSSPPVQTKVVVTQAPTVAKEIAGASGTWAAVGGDGRLVCRVRAAPAPSFVWTTQEGLAIQNSEKYSLHDPQLVDGLVLWAAVLEVRQVGAADYAHYTCTAHNALGSDSTALALNPPARPHPPSNFTVTNVSTASVSVAWTPNFDGGLPRGYTIRYRPAGTLDYQFVDISGGNTAGTTLGGLTSGTEYFFSIQAKNDQGRSEYLSPPILVTLKAGVGGGGDGESGGGERWRAPRLILLIMSLTGAALLVLNVAIIACFVRRRSRARRASGSSSTKPVALDTYCGTPDSTPGPHHSEGFLSLTTRASNNVSNSPSSYKEEQQTSIDRCERPSTGSSSMAEIRPNITLLQNGTLARKNSTSSTQNGGVVNRTPSFNIQSSGSLRQNGGIPSQPQQGNRGSSPSVTPLNGRIPNQGKVHPPNNPEVCSLTSTCDSQHPHHHHQHQHHQRRDSGSLPADDQVSLSSYQSNHSRTYSQGYVRPLPPPGCPHHPPPRQQIQPLYQSHPYHQQQPEQQPRHHHHGPPTYSSLNPSGLYNLSSEYFDSRCNQSSFSTGTPAGYATLGPRSRRATPSQFATLQRPQPSRPHIQNHSQNSGHECSVPPRCQSDCCRPLQKNDEDERRSISACQVNHGTLETEHHHHPRRSSFHGPLRRESQRYDVVVPVPHSHLAHQQRQDSGAPGHTTTQNQNSLSPESDTAQLQDNESPGYSTAKYQESGSPGYSVPEQEDSRPPGCSIPQQQDSKLPEKNSAQQKDWGGNSIGHHSLSQSHNLSGGNTFTSQSNLAKQESAQNSSSTSPPHRRDSSLRRDFSFRNNSSHKDAGTSGRPRFPHDYVRQGSTKGKTSSRGPREGSDASHNTDKSNK